MDLIRDLFDSFYDSIKPIVFYFTQNDPKKAHELFAGFCKYLHNSGLEKFVLDNSSNYQKLGFEISNAAGFNKDGQFHPAILKYFGFDRVVVGTVTGDPWEGNPRPSIVRFPETGSMVNWEGLPGTGAKAVARQLESYEAHEVPITINFMSTPKKQGDELLLDLEKTILLTRWVPYVDRFELNISCPNTHSSGGKIDARRENLKMLDAMLSLTDSCVFLEQEIYLKVSPDSIEADVRDTLETASRHRVSGITATNTTTNHNPLYIPKSPGKGGASGNAVYQDSLRVQKLYHDVIKEMRLKLELIAVGGIDSPERVQERIDNGAREIQIYTPLVLEGPKLIRELKSYQY